MGLISSISKLLNERKQLRVEKAIADIREYCISNHLPGAMVTDPDTHKLCAIVVYCTAFQYTEYFINNKSFTGRHREVTKIVVGHGGLRFNVVKKRKE